MPCAHSLSLSLYTALSVITIARSSGGCCRALRSASQQLEKDRWSPPAYGRPSLKVSRAAPLLTLNTKMKLSSILFRDRNRSQAHTTTDYNPSAVGFCPPKRDRSKSLCVPHAMPLIRVETCKEDVSVPSNVQDLLRKRRTSMAV